MTEPVGEKREKMIAKMAESVGVTPDQFLDAVKRRVAKEATNADLLLFLHTANTYGLDPLATPPQIALFVPKNKEGGVPKSYVTFDGWLRILVSHPRYYNHGWKDEVWNGGQRGRGTLDAITFWIEKWVPDKSTREISEHTELLAECLMVGDYTPWNKWPARMLKEKAAMQGTRFCFAMYVPDLDDVIQAEQFETARAEAAAPAAPPQGPIAPAAAIPGARKRKAKAEEPTAPALPAPAAQETVDDFLRGRSDDGFSHFVQPTPTMPERELAAASLFPETPAPSQPATLPAFDPAESLRVDMELAKTDGEFDDLL